MNGFLMMYHAPCMVGSDGVLYFVVGSHGVLYSVVNLDGES